MKKYKKNTELGRGIPSGLSVESIMQNMAKRMYDDVAERFWAKVERRGPDECWPWIATRNNGKFNYGHFQFMGRVRKASRISYMLSHGDIPPRMVVMHTCDNPPCVNPSHLKLGTQHDNVLDCAKKGRRANLKGEDHPRAKLKKSDVDAIRDAYAEGVSAADLAKSFGVNRGQIHSIMARRAWRDL